MSLADLDEIVERWEKLCASVTISVGDGLTADFVEDLADVSNQELFNLTIRTEDPTVAVSLKHDRAEISYSDEPEDRVAISSIRQSLRAHKIRTPFYRMKIFWGWIYALIIMGAIFADDRLQSMQKPPLPRIDVPFELQPPPPPPPPPFSTTILIVTLLTFILVTAWFIYSYTKLDGQSSTRIKRK
jgi:hypothetical protein